ncbi:polysaccharide deacetylase family protein [Sulfitobacter pseudonitzschiae]|uniref:Chitooligosaccharide deacetylase n=1 Tax=Pseudosulfitobacter pseudonitzschiae TaxID=1402135 RepID=A0A9Q2RZD2_9RHOB|nr:polysaccharide deacetylase family protein [Pseudosulfitobacter pseudonitzschiae]MBM2294572.1 polysaccharide deacetylase family protein [Pseudosulfitobacter pseudonitzschiae]MBM2299539.1 polysaccharide deacetylase family protein [Pseudosulfitobacter pseudonitzschiae]MBM2304439.1 polysaccharide deacetylase family protein [Pseudosulfitobacter pseudonitzschiae]MBM2314185.1 polysaccharide deacetylase family protein [Pseudosulfitobacter pseudonitzschiae]MBM2319100.1 polysaccharide deacetylase fam
MNILTFDIEDWFHILDNPKTVDIEQWNSFPSRIDSGVSRLLDFCDRTGVKATFFILGWVAETAPEIVAEISRRGHEIACHSYRHQLVYSQTPEEFERDLAMALDHIEAATGIRPTAYRAPGFSITRESTWAFDILARNGIDTDASVFPALRAHGGLPGFPSGEPCHLETISGQHLKIFPMSYGRVFGRRIVFSGGGYFRLLPYSALKLGFDRSDYVMTYFHPRDFDPEQPIVPGLGPVRQFKSYVGLGTSLARLERLADKIDFISIGEAIIRTDWSSVPLLASGDLFSTA